VHRLTPDELPDDSVLVDFDTATVLDALSVGIVLLDSQLCAAYANVMAEDALALQVENVRGQPLTRFLHQPQLFLDAVNRALAGGEAVEFQLNVSGADGAKSPGSVPSRIAPLGYQVTGPYLLLEVSASLWKSQRPIGAG